MSALSVEAASDENLGIQYVSDEQGDAVSVIVPIELWQALMSERETTHLLKSEVMKRRLLERQRQGGMSLEEVREKLGI